MLKYDNKDCNQFVEDMEAAGFDVEHYRGRFFWEGPAVRCDRDTYQDVMGATKVRLQEDSMGLGSIVYPKRSGRLLQEAVQQEEVDQVEVDHEVDFHYHRQGRD